MRFIPKKSHNIPENIKNKNQQKLAISGLIISVHIRKKATMTEKNAKFDHYYHQRSL
jgi:hypothetical protein